MDSLLDLPTIHPLAGPPLIDALLADQQNLTAVERFARLHDSGKAETAARLYRDLIPLEAPRPGEQYAFSVDLDACSGCKACVTACHSLNGLDDGETFRDVGALTGRDRGGLHVLQHVTTACHHCLEPACLTGCPTLAYDKDPQTGIVRHLDDQCIGCQYCTLMCPYDVPKYNPAKGIVRKCDMCRQRLVDNEAPACVQACPNQAIRIELVRADVVRQHSNQGSFLAHASDPRLTQPTTRFVTRRSLKDIEPVAEPLRPAHAHVPLVVMLVLTQMSIGMLLVAETLHVVQRPALALKIVAVGIGAAGLVAAIFHLGRPQIAYRAWLGWRTSWMSREIIVFQIWLLFAIAFLASGAGGLGHFFGIATAIAGTLAIFCSAMIYAATGRRFWSAQHTIVRFLLSAAALGTAGSVAIGALQAQEASLPLTAAMLAATVLRTLADALGLQRLRTDSAAELARSYELLNGPLSIWNTLQASVAMLGGVVLPAVMLAAPQFAVQLALPAFVLLLAAELIQRGLFFAACISPGMPGVNHS